MLAVARIQYERLPLTEEMVGATKEPLNVPVPAVTLKITPASYTVPKDVLTMICELQNEF